MIYKKEKIWGRLLDNEGRCIHWHSKLDVIANRCALCGKYYACYKCHDLAEDHAFVPYPINSSSKIVMCGVCGYQFTYKHYQEIKVCDRCKSPFNPRCSLHQSIYVYK